MVAIFEYPNLGTFFYIVLLFYPLLGGWYWKKGLDHRLHEKCSAGCWRKMNRFPERPTSAGIALYKQSNLNCDSKWFYVYKGSDWYHLLFKIMWFFFKYSSVVWWSEFRRTRVQFPALSDFLRSSGSGTGSTQPREDIWGASWMEK
jgi:hypothetical protein